MVDDQLEFELESIIASKLSCKRLHYLVAWKGYPASENCWIFHCNLNHTQEMLQEFHKNNPQAIGLVKATLAAMKLPPATKNYALAAVPGVRKSLLPKKESNVMAIVFPGVAWPKLCHPGKPSPKPCLLAVIVDLNLTIDCKWVEAQEIGSKWGADAPRPIFPFLTCFSTNPDLKEGQIAAYRTTIGGVCKLSKYCVQGGHLIKMYPKVLNSALSPLQFPGNLPPPAEMIPEPRKLNASLSMLLIS
ncbi:hypothetical protein DSO57_1013347 [Entomophthora muscae]|uniref:Uncharacterized protein n=1 Tax=Entomophthora muscae TaxID=34485 RepID=A0ACC2UQT8_9FUNG|nr:hypothetical protein DSO57_1013347 [Entomophthora muscae]